MTVGYIYICPMCGAWRVISKKLLPGEHIHCDAIVKETYNHDVSCGATLTDKNFSDTW